MSQAKKVVEELVEEIIKGFSIDSKPFPSFFICLYFM